jgi:enoyl-CoA hydratase
VTTPVHSSVDGGVRTITLDRPPANAVNQELLLGLCDAFAAANDDWDTKVVVLDSALPKFFCAGADVKSPRPVPDERRDRLRVPSTAMAIGRDAFAAIHDCAVPVIAKVQGTAVGGGVLFAALADIAVVSEAAKLGLFEAKVRAVGGAGILRRALSEQAVRYLMWSARLVEASTLRTLGAGMVILPPEDVDGEVAALTQEITSLDADVVRHLKAAFNEIERGDPLGAYGVEQKYTAMLGGRRNT